MGKPTFALLVGIAKLDANLQDKQLRIPLDSQAKMWLDAPRRHSRKQPRHRCLNDIVPSSALLRGSNDAERRATLLRVRYCGLFATDGRAARLEYCRALIDAASAQATAQAAR